MLAALFVRIHIDVKLMTAKEKSPRAHATITEFECGGAFGLRRRFRIGVLSYVMAALFCLDVYRCELMTAKEKRRRRTTITEFELGGAVQMVGW